MKTRVMQNEPGEPQKAADPAPSQSTPPTNIAGRMGRWSAGHWKTAVFGWLAFVVLAVMLGTVVGTKAADGNAGGAGESKRADQILDAGFKQPAGETVLIQSETLTASDPEFAAAIEDTAARLDGLEQVINIRAPLGETNAAQISEDGHSAIIDFQIRGEFDKAGDQIDPVVAEVAAIAAAHPALFVGQFGDASTDKEVTASFMEDLKKAGLISVPITLIILIIAFGALVAAGIPILLALTAVLATLGFMAIPSHYPPDGRGRLRDRAPDRARGRGGLLALLPQARTRGASRRAQRRGRPPGRRFHVGPLGAHLRADRDGRHVRHVPHRGQGLRDVRPGDDAGRRHRDARLAHRPAGASLPAGRQRRPGPRAVRQPASA